MNVFDLQGRLAAASIDVGRPDGVYGPKTRAGVLRIMTTGPDTRLTEQDFSESAARQTVQVAAVKAVASVESSGDGDVDGDGRPDILFEGHRFSRATRHRFDRTHSAVSYPTWDRTRYPRAQADRYAQLVTAIGLDVDAGFASASYGMFQILGENFAACGFASPYDFAVAMAQDEERQLIAFEAFVRNAGLLRHLRNLDWAAFAAGYNGSGYRANRYDERLADAYHRFAKAA